MKLENGDLIFFGKETFDGTCNGCKRQLCHCFICCGTCSEYTHVGIIKVEDNNIFVYESARHHHNKVDKEGVQKVPLNYYKDRDWYVRKRKPNALVPKFDNEKYSKGYNWCMWDWCRALIRCRSCCRYSKKTFCSEYVAAQLKMNDPDLMTPKDLAKNPDIPYEDIKGPISKVFTIVSNPMGTVKFKF